MVQVELLQAMHSDLTPQSTCLLCLGKCQVKLVISDQCSTNSLIGDNDQQELEQEHVEEEC